MSDIRAEILNTGNPKVKSAAIEIAATSSRIFEILADPKQHQIIDGSKSVKGLNWGPSKLFLGAKFGMKMKIGINYRVTNTVVEFTENKLIAWRHLGRWIWRYEISELPNGHCRVVESFDGRPSPFQWWLKSRGAYPYVEKAAAKTLVRLKEVAERPIL